MPLLMSLSWLNYYSMFSHLYCQRCMADLRFVLQLSWKFSAEFWFWEWVVLEPRCTGKSLESRESGPSSGYCCFPNLQVTNNRNKKKFFELIGSFASKSDLKSWILLFFIFHFISIETLSRRILYVKEN
jgi:hypothetical protein